MGIDNGAFRIEADDIVRLELNPDAEAGNFTRTGWVNVGAFAVYICIDEKGDLELQAFPCTNEVKALAVLKASKAKAMTNGATDLDNEGA